MSNVAVEAEYKCHLHKLMMTANGDRQNAITRYRDAPPVNMSVIDAWSNPASEQILLDIAIFWALPL